MRRSASSVAGASGTLASLGDSVKWDVVGIGNGQHVIRARGSKTSYLAGSSQLLNATVSMQTVSDSTVPNNCRWTVSYDNGTVFTNVATGYVLCEMNGELRVYPSSSAQNKRWRCATTIQYGDGSALSNILRELDGNFSISAMSLKTGETKTPVINKTPTSATVAWATASDFTYEASPKELIDINEFTGEITGLKGGNATVTATHKTTGRIKSFAVQVIAPSKDPLHQDNIEYIRYTRIPSAETNHFISVVKSKIYTSEIFAVYNESNGLSKEFLVNENLKNKLNNWENGYQSHFLKTWASVEESAAHAAKLETDQLVEKGYFSNRSVEYYGVWASNYEVELELYRYWSGVINKGAAVYSVYMTISYYYYAYLATATTATVSSSQYSTMSSQVDNIENALSGMSYTGKKVVTAESRNAVWQTRGYTNPPYKANTPVMELKTGQQTKFVRVYSDPNRYKGSWIMRAEDIQGLTARQIRDKYALPATPTQICDVYVPSGQQIYVGIAGEIEGFGYGGGIQFDLDWNTTNVTFTNIRNLP